ncbi:MAG: prepilin-type N-terminal cleavage/methylation domain-containing protein [Phycisphaerales bacterium]|nr:prepilin-type N-terminal cleavage/methylation domain-containing protein [Phycisphaerales bacterium]
MRRRGFTLLEATVTTMVLSVVAVAVLPVMNGATEAFSAASQTERMVDETSYALDRVLRVLREAPAGTDAGTIGVISLTATMVVFSDGTGCRLQGNALELRSGGGEWSELCSDVEGFELRALNADGAETSAAPAQVQRFEVRLMRGEFELRSVVFCRARYGQ